jgi:hypothetical protein
LWCGGLTLFHVLADLVVGFSHELAGPASPAVALNTYGRAPHLAITLELLFALGCVAWYQRAQAQRARPLSRKRALALYATFAVGIAAWYPAATLSLREQFALVGIHL